MISRLLLAISAAAILASVSLMVPWAGEASVPGPKNEARTREDAVKLHSVEAVPRAQLGVVRLDGVFTSAGTDIRRPTGTAFTGDGRFSIIDNASAIFTSQLARGRASAPRRVIAFDPIDRPSRARFVGGRLYVAQTNWIDVLDSDGRVHHAIRSFYTINDFAVVNPERFVIAPVGVGRSGPLVVEVDASGRRVAEYGERVRTRYGETEQAVAVESCGGTRLVAVQHSPDLQLFAPPDTVPKTIDIGYPGRAELGNLEAASSLVHPAPAVFRLPSYIAGLSCDVDSYLVLLDLPGPYLVRLSADGTVVARYASDEVIAGRHFMALATARQGSTTKVAAVFIDRDGTRGVVLGHLEGR